MDLYRVVTAAGDIRNKLPIRLVSEFIAHADKDFDKTELNEKEKSLRKILKDLSQQLSSIKDDKARLKWTEDVMTIRCRL